ncbi:unnamed protein product [Cuscuta campestris]|uniref:C2H2-type domain-containing protein n=2 Tax=Cuscuta sect. Cleistogrammica TaxID=1824901 RepID=A0A484KL57_9ASTE|nr:hypothetical protein DM860_006203 [Cuscuta australis]VFQ63849.1 unnamed protein product [Cuscuta campestris]
MEISCFQYSSPNCSPEEEDDMAANCLILLAQGGGGSHQSAIKAAARKFSDMAASGAAAIDAYLYECKTCNRAFSSFQALGGHRASHKKPKLVVDLQHHDHPHPATTAVRKEIPPPILACPEKAPKIHECSICGAEFSSGQALGGHMRRHRPVVATNAAPVTRDVGTESSVNHDSVPRGGLDLNLPAPQEEEDEEGNSSNNNNANNKFEFSGKQQSLVFSAPPLVDCHY